jgi:hypothetical protein
LRKQERFQVDQLVRNQRALRVQARESSASALFFARATRNPSQRVPDNVVESTNNQVNAATDETISLFDSPSGLPQNVRQALAAT